MLQSYKTNLALIVLLPILVAVIALPSTSPTELPASPGRFLHDFDTYWAAFHLLLSGQNPYESQTLTQATGALGSESGPLFQPPWTLALLSPLLFLPIDAARIIWGLAQILSIIFLVKSCAGISRQKIPAAIWIIFCLVSFLPLLDNFFLGQFSLLAASLMAMAILRFNEKRYFSSGILMGWASIKLQIVFLPAAFLFFISLKNKHWGFPIGAALVLSLGLVTVLCIEPQAFSWFLDNPNSLFEFTSASLPTIIRISLPNPTSPSAIWPHIFCPLLAISFCLFLALNQKLPIPENKIVIALCLGMFLTPYGHLFDQVSLLIIELFIFIRAFNAGVTVLQRYALICPALICQSLVFFQRQFYSVDYPFFWLPIGMLLTWFVTLKLEERIKR